MKINEIMTQRPTLFSPNDSIEKVAKWMLEKNVGLIPIGKEDKILGVLTDRDITIRATAKGLPHSTLVEKIFTKKTLYCLEDDEVSEAAKEMEKQQVRRLLVYNNDKKLVGVVTLGDIVNKSGNEQLSSEILNCVSKAA